MKPMASPPKAWVVPRRSRPGQRGGVALKSGAGGGLEKVTSGWARLVNQCHRWGLLSQAAGSAAAVGRAQ